MRRSVILPVLAVLLFASCSSKNSIYEKTIADYTQTDEKGTLHDLKFKAIEIKELKNISVADSINMLTEEFNEARSNKIKMGENIIAKYQEQLDMEKKAEQEGKPASKKIMETCEQQMSYAQHLVDSIKAVKPDLKGYDSKNKEDVLVRLVECKYSIIPPTYNSNIEETFVFILSADGTQCFTRYRVKE